MQPGSLDMNGQTGVMGQRKPQMYAGLASWFHLLTPPSDYEGEAAEVLGLLEAT